MYKTRSAKAKLSNASHVEDEETTLTPQNPDDSDTPPPKKRRKSQNTVKSASSSGAGSKGKSLPTEGKKLYRGKNAGKLVKMLDMPVEIFCEISGYLHPLDLLHLARASHSFNDMLMSRNSKPIWRNSRMCLNGLPDCPPDLSEPAYASLVFEKTCQVCLAPRVLKVDYDLHIRLCHRCRPGKIVRGSQLLKTISGLTVPLLECIPRRKRMCSRNRSTLYFYTAHAESVVAKFNSLISEDMPEEEAQFVIEEFYDRKKESLKGFAEHAELLEQWLEINHSVKQDDRIQAAHRREISLRAHLVELGYNEDDFPTHWEDEEWTNIMNQPRDLTPRIWAKVQPKLEASIQRVKESRAERNRAFRREWRKQELMSLIPVAIGDRKERNGELSMKISDTLLLPSVVALFEVDDYEHEITQEKWDASWPQIEKEMDAFASSARKAVLDLIRTSDPEEKRQAFNALKLTSGEETDADRDAEALRLAYFQCKNCLWCPTPLKYPALLEHVHSIEDMTFDASTTKYAALLLSSYDGPYGENALHDMGCQLQCLLCEEDARCMAWDELINHFRREQGWCNTELMRQRKDPSLAKVALYNDHALENGRPAFKVLSWDEVSAVTQKMRPLWEDRPSMSCTLCQWPPSNKNQVESHIRRNHLKEPEPHDMKTRSGSGYDYDF